MLDQDEPFSREEIEALEQEFMQQPPILQLSDDLSEPPPPKAEPNFELKPLPKHLKYAYLDENKIYHIIISGNHSKEEEDKLLNVIGAHREAIGYSLYDLKGIS
jgi:hypothetical protein